MPLYDYRCTHCGHAFEIQRSIKAEFLKTCDQCGEEALELVVSAVPICTKGDPKTLGHLADRNRDKMGNYEYQDKNAQLDERKNRGRKAMGLPEKPVAPWWRPGTTAPNPEVLKIAQQAKTDKPGKIKMTPEVKAYIEKGTMP